MLDPALDNAVVSVGAGLMPARIEDGQTQGITPTTADLYSGLKQWQRDVLSARLIIIREIEDYQKETGRSLNKAIKVFLASISNGGPAHLKRAATEANNRKGTGRLLSAPTIYRWFKVKDVEGNAGLIPADKEETSEDIPLWFPGFLDYYRQPSKPSIPHALKEMGADAPPYHQVVRYLKKFSNLDLHRGRMSGSELRAIRAYTKRDFSDLQPMDIIVADGHSFKSYIAHPVHGKRFLPEVETVIDAASRSIVGWSAGLAESGQIVADAIRYAVTVGENKPMGGLPAIFYADNGAGNRAKMNSDEVVGILARIGCTPKFGIAGNPQGRGVIERLNKTLWIPAAKELVTYNGKDMDQLALRKRLKIVDKDLKETGRSQHLLSWPQFLGFIAAKIEEYNNHPHSTLPKIIDAGGNRRHMTPAERWKVFAAEGWQPDTLNPEEMRDLFRPQISCTTRRGLVTVFTNEYFSKELEHHHGETVFVNYDIHDPQIVWVRDTQQRLICEAVWGGNRRAFYPISVVEQAREKRKDRRLALKHEQIREIEAEAAGVIDGEMRIPDACLTLTPTLSPGERASESAGEGNVGADLVSARIEEGQAQDLPLQEETGEQPRTIADDHIADAGKVIRPFFSDEIERYEWHLRNGFREDADMTFKIEFEASDNYRMLYLQQ